MKVYVLKDIINDKNLGVYTYYGQIYYRICDYYESEGDYELLEDFKKKWDKIGISSLNAFGFDYDTFQLNAKIK